MDATPRLQLPYIAPQQAQKQVTYNEAMQALDVLVQPSVKSRAGTSPPLSPAVGDSYVVAPAATGAWAGKDHKIATWRDGGWLFRTPGSGWVTYVDDTSETAIFTSGAWATFATNGGTSLSKLGINTSADFVNRLAVVSEGSLFSNDGANHRLKINKAGTGNTASVLLQSGFTGHAELGLAGDNNFRLKVSDNGTSWLEALLISRTSGLVTLPLGQLAFPPTQNPSSNPNTLDDYEEGSWTPALTFGGGSAGIAYGANHFGRYTKIGRLCCLNATLHLSSKGTSTGSAVIGALPFAPPRCPALGGVQRGLHLRDDPDRGGDGAGFCQPARDCTLCDPQRRLCPADRCGLHQLNLCLLFG